MANIQSQIKRNRQNERRRLRNRNIRGSARTAVNQARATMAKNAPEESRTSVLQAIKELDRSAGKGVIHANKAARIKSRLVKRLAAMGGTSVNKEDAASAEAKPAKKTRAKKTAEK